jgi:oxygen-independent coproporphyrinogen-3 oxidase
VARADLGVYVHIPFCATRCDYCAFATWTDRAHLIDDYLDACVTDVERRRASGELVEAATVYFGGGTPSLVPADGLLRVLDAIPLVPDAEVTIECNPDSIALATLRTYRAAGVTRISLGVQSTQPHVLAALGRSHDRDNVARAVEWICAADIPTFNLDLIAGTAGESDADFDTTLDDVLAFDPPHVSVYGLMVEPGTPLEQRIAAGDVAPPDPDVQADRYLRADDRLTAHGLEWYEVSNWSRPGHECRHNQGYWTGADCVAIGAAAHGHRAATGTRTWNSPLPERYVERIRTGSPPEVGRETVDGETRARERLGLALRTREGARLDRSEAVHDLEALGLLTHVGGAAVLTPRGRLLATEVTLRILGPDADHRIGTRYDGLPTPQPASNHVALHHLDVHRADSDRANLDQAEP